MRFEFQKKREQRTENRDETDREEKEINDLRVFFFFLVLFWTFIAGIGRSLARVGLDCFFGGFYLVNVKKEMKLKKMKKK